MSLPTPHGDKLVALLVNTKLPQSDKERVQEAVKRYEAWVTSLTQISGDVQKLVQDGVALLQDYRLFLDMELIFDSTDDFLYRQKGQLKLDNTVIEEFLPHLVSKAFPELSKQFDLGPKACFAALYFTSTLRTATGSPGILTRAKDQDFAMAKRVYVKASFDPSLQTTFRNHRHPRRIRLCGMQDESGQNDVSGGERHRARPSNRRARSQVPAAL